ncbi:uncharacterized protein C8Q71DRAFT_791331 [Rhodofomes roseus]|uniref:Zona occludens toxin N-terminal domain-containing protein n=1 Tax=Rhodofomes roseus TaxID=34475 RepID=A0ABQ8JZ11_9APHY|nr:uncharacterized protein C8Q71DRAFT_791331 [Rhodofomes roseus]KAH9829259.1 hypothetical protein C8Q71DRAFT_791331 [Rhodofomes roseus]
MPSFKFGPAGDLSDSSSDASGPSSTAASSVDGDMEEHQLLVHQVLDNRGADDHEIKTSPIFTRDAYAQSGGPDCFPQRGLLGSVVEIHDSSGPCIKDQPDDRRIYLNTNAPFSALVCGVQGSGKSHTTSVMLEDMFVPDNPSIGQLQKPLAGLVLHFGEGGAYSQPCEAAWVGVTDDKSIKPPPVVVYVSKSSLNTMKKVYARLGPSVTVRALKFSEEELDAQAFLSMMAIGASDHVPLYMQTILSILRDLGERYTYQNFRTMLEQKKAKFNPAQLSGLEQRTALLESFLDKKVPGKAHVAPARFVAGQLTIIDLSDPFIDPASACGLFEILVRLFVRAQVDTGKVLVVDEAHKYLQANKTSSGLTKELLSLIRQQRHQAMRVIISTQEPTVVPPVLLELCGVAILHRFSSPAWWEHVAKHVSADIDSKTAFDIIVKLQTGQAMLLAPSGLGTSRESSAKPADDERRVLRHFGRKCVVVKTRLRITKDGGASLLVIPS